MGMLGIILLLLRVETQASQPVTNVPYMLVVIVRGLMWDGRRMWWVVGLWRRRRWDCLVITLLLSFLLPRIPQRRERLDEKKRG